jgi:uncharacterized protein
MLLAAEFTRFAVSPRAAAAIVDRHGERIIAAMSIATGAMIALFFAFVISMASLAPAHAANETPAPPSIACKGKDLTSSITDPAMVAEVEKAVAETPNGGSLLWRIEKDGAEPSFLFGTMHVSDPRVVTLPPQAEKAFAAARSLVIETTDVLDPANASRMMMARPEMMMFVDGTSLENHIPADDLPMVRETLSKRGMPFASVRFMKPWILTGVLAMPGCETARRGTGLEILDIHLATRAKNDGKPVDGLETALEQMEAMASLPIDGHVKGLVETLRMGDTSDDVFETMIALYAAGDTARIMPTIGAAMLSINGEQGVSEADAAAMQAFERTMITNRNHTMVDRLPDHLAKGGAFVAIGTLHLPGREGVVELLRQQGYTVTPVR